jgi:hypothetical protein
LVISFPLLLLVQPGWEPVEAPSPALSTFGLFTRPSLRWRLLRVGLRDAYRRDLQLRRHRLRAHGDVESGGLALVVQPELDITPALEVLKEEQDLVDPVT